MTRQRISDTLGHVALAGALLSLGWISAGLVHGHAHAPTPAPVVHTYDYYGPTDGTGPVIIPSPMPSTSGDVVTG